MKVPVLDSVGREIRSLEVLSGRADVRVNQALLHQAVVRDSANRRIVRAHTKTRGDVRGGGRKPWRQKGTGRARHGSIRSPLWKGGGVVFGPRAGETCGHRMPRKMRKAALTQSLVAKVRTSGLRVVEAFPETQKTKDLASLLRRLQPAGRVLVVAEPPQLPQLRRAGRNLPWLRVADPRALTAAEVLLEGTLVTTPAGWSLLETRIR